MVRRKKRGRPKKPNDRQKRLVIGGVDYEEANALRKKFMADKHLKAVRMAYTDDEAVFTFDTDLRTEDIAERLHTGSWGTSFSILKVTRKAVECETD